MYRKKIEKKKTKMLEGMKKFFYEMTENGEDSDSSLEGLSCDEPKNVVDLNND